MLSDRSRMTVHANLLEEVRRLQGRVLALEQENQQLRALNGEYRANMRGEMGHPLTQRRTAEAALHLSEDRYHQLIDAVTDYAIFMLDGAGYVITWSRGAEKNEGYEAREILGQHFSVFYTNEDREAGRPERTLAAVRRDGRFEDQGWRVRKDGSRFWANVVITALRDRQGTVTGFAKITRNLTAKRAAEEQERALVREQLAREASELARTEMERANRVKDEFLATMSHELRTPLNAIAGWATILRTSLRDEIKLERGLEIIARNAKAQERLVSDLLDVSRIVNGKLQLNLALTELLPTLTAAAEVVRPAAESKGVQLVLHIDPKVGAVMVDADRLQQVVWNLLTNAIRFSSRGARVTLCCERARAGLTITVSDSGVGIAAEKLPHVFERFTQIDGSTTRAHGGLGLGLAIVRHLVEAHGGSVEASSAGLGHGATFTIVLPTAALETNELGTQANSLASGSLRDLRILAVDDDPDSLEFLYEILKSAGAEVTTATNAREAYEVLHERDGSAFALLISDIGMPEEDGYSLIRRLRASPSVADIPAIALTAYARESDAALAKAAGFQEHLIKPIDVRRLLLAAKEWARR